MIRWGAMTKLQDDVTFLKQSDIDIVFSNIGQAAGSANGTEFQPLWMHTPVHMQSTAGYLTITYLQYHFKHKLTSNILIISLLF
jgi:hypothetical protein